MKNTNFKTQKEFEEWNEEMAKRYDPEAYHERSFFLIRLIERRRVNVILDLLEIRPNHLTLEVGCGAGNVLELARSHRRIGIDLSAFLLSKAHRRLKNSAALLMANAENIPFAPCKFDRLICTEVLEHVQNPYHVLEEMARVAKDDAIIVVSIPNEKMIDTIKSIFRKLNLFSLFKTKQGNYVIPEKMTDEWHLHQFDIKLLKKVTPSFLQIIDIRAIPFSFFPLRYVIKLVLKGNQQNSMIRQ